ncbi:hypothetical protein H6G76_34795 [Nostoc sp. FACHB-152]|uniref:hypothetical protein n=1 Tax=Nostoc sp. FACHB-152 TaxID=2692837 RepID=UPI00168558C8|nr:hypothetical protein [Nostoc sp. FACHB-152]MBD2452184.1 hypothetical protein [Nostoc sp. FACHB-152]
MEHLYTKKQAAQLREQILDLLILPTIKADFGQDNKLQSAVMVVAQFWDDEASDAVHHIILYSDLKTPNIETIIRSYDDIYEGMGAYLSSREYFLEVKIDEETSYWWDANRQAIPAFAAFCQEGSHQCMDISEAYTPYAIFRRQNEDIEVEIVGKMLRPWLDGIKPDWE